VIEARDGAPRGGTRATLHVLCLPLLLLAPVGCRTYDYHHSWYEPYDYDTYGYHHHHEAPPRAYRPVAPLVIVVPRVSQPPLPAYVPPKPPEPHFEHHHQQRSGGDSSRHLNRDSHPDHKRGK